MYSQKDKEDIEEISNELELADDDEKVSYVAPFSFEQTVQYNAFSKGLAPSRSYHYRYKVGDSFFMLPLSDVQELLTDDLRKAEEAASAVQEKLDGVKEEKQELKIALYARFGKSINLET